MVDWQLRGDYVELCNCDPGCGCNFRALPNSEEGNCEAFTCSVVDEGRHGDVDLKDCAIAWALWWPGAIHEKGGRGHAFVRCDTDAQFAAIRTIWRGEAGYPYFEIFNSTFDEPTTVERADVDVTLDGIRSSFSVRGIGEAAAEPLTNPVTGAENDVRIVKSGGFIWKDGAVARGKRLKVDAPGIQMDHVGRHAVVSRFEWSNV